MSDRALKRLVGALVVAVGIWMLTSMFAGGSGAIGASGEIASLFDELDGPSLTAVRMEGVDGAVRLERTGDRWTANGYRADQGAVTTLLSAVTSASIGELIAANPDNHERMGVDDGAALRVTFTTTSGDRSMLLGQTRPRSQASYVRTPGADEVYLLEGRIGSELRRNEAAWRDRTMVATDSAAVTRVVLTGDRSYVLVRGDSVWTLEDGAPVEPSLVSGMLAELSSLVATGFYTESDSIAQMSMAYTISALAGDGTVLAEVAIGEGDGDRWGRVSTDDYLYRVSAFRAARLGPERSALSGGE